MNSIIDQPVDPATMKRRLLLVLDKLAPQLLARHQMPPWMAFLAPILPAALRMSSNQLKKTDLTQMQQFHSFMLSMLQNVADSRLSDEQFLEVMTHAAAANEPTETTAELRS